MARQQVIWIDPKNVARGNSIIRRSTKREGYIPRITSTGDTREMKSNGAPKAKITKRGDLEQP